MPLALPWPALASPGESRAAGATNTIRFVPQADLSSIDPIWTTATVAFNHGFLVYDSLYGIDDQLRPQPQMVKGHEISDDKLTWIFTLRDGLLFHDNEPVRAIDCVTSIKRWAKRKGFGQTLMSLTEEIKALDDKRFQIKLTTPFPAHDVSRSAAPISARSCHSASPKRTPSRRLPTRTGSGPFRFLPEERVAGSHYAYAKFEKYVPRSEPPSFWAGGKVVYVDRVEWRVIPDFATQANALQTGEVDWVEAPLIDLLSTLRKDKGVQVVTLSPLPQPAVMALNHTQPPFDNEKLHQALLPAIDQTEFMTAVVGDQGDLMSVPCGLFTPGTPMANGRDMSVFTGKRDLALAKKLVAESGYKGEKIVLMLPTDQATLIPMVQVTRDLFARLGLNVDMQSMDWGDAGGPAGAR